MLNLWRLPPNDGWSYSYSMTSLESVRCHGNRYDLLPGIYYHLPTPDTFGQIFLWNVWIGEGLCASVSAIAALPGLEHTVTGYFLHNMHNQKERLWETIREFEYPILPSRMKAFFLFDDPDAVSKAQQLWFPNESRIVLEARVVTTAMLHRADARWLDSHESEWETSARNYWSARMTDDPIVECIAYGQVYFPRWREPPFGRPVGIVPDTEAP